MTSTSPCSSPSDRQNTDEDTEEDSASNTSLPVPTMFEFIYTEEEPNNDKTWTDICSRIRPFLWRATEADPDANMDEVGCWWGRKIDTCQYQGRNYHVYDYRDKEWDDVTIMIIRQIGPDVHVNIEMVNQKKIQFVYTMSGNLICELDTDRVAELPTMKEFIRRKIGLTCQQQVIMHNKTTVKDLLLLTG